MKRYGMAITSEPGGTYSVIFNAQYAIDPSDRTAQTAADMRAAYYLEGGRIRKLLPAPSLPEHLHPVSIRWPLPVPLRQVLLLH
jgi:hypothetical protein